MQMEIINTDSAGWTACPFYFVSPLARFVIVSDPRRLGPLFPLLTLTPHSPFLDVVQPILEIINFLLLLSRVHVQYHFFDVILRRGWRLGSSLAKVRSLWLCWWLCRSRFKAFGRTARDGIGSSLSWVQSLRLCWQRCRSRFKKCGRTARDRIIADGIIFEKGFVIGLGRSCWVRAPRCRGIGSGATVT